MDQYCIYLRKSRADAEAEARGDGETLARHEKALLELAKRQELNIMAIHKEVVSGETIASRPVMQQLLSEVEQGIWQGVLVMEVERLARGDTMDQGLVAQTFKYSGTKIITPMKIYDPNNEYDEEYFEFGLFMSRREYKTINRRLQNGRIASVKEGKFVGNTPPYGYSREKLKKDKGFMLVPHPDEADIVRMIFQLYTKGELQDDGTYRRLGVSLIKRKLNDMKIPASKGGVWTESTLQGLLQNPTYAGYIRWNWRKTVKKMTNGALVKERPRAKDYILIDGLHEPLIDSDTWKLSQFYYGLNKPVSVPKNDEIRNPLAGLIVCGVCGRKMKRRPYSNKNPDTLMCPFSSCPNVSSKLSYVETALLKGLEKWMEDYKFQLDLKDEESGLNLQTDIKRNTVKKLDEEMTSLETQMDSIHDLLEKGIYTTDKFLERSKIISDKLLSAKEAKEILLTEIALDEEREKAKKTIIPKIEKVIELYNASDSAAYKNELLKQVIEKAVYTKTVNGRWHNRPDDFQLDLFPNYEILNITHRQD